MGDINRNRRYKLYRNFGFRLDVKDGRMDVGYAYSGSLSQLETYWSNNVEYKAEILSDFVSGLIRNEKILLIIKKSS